MALVAGVDGCPGGWLCVIFDTDIGFRDVIIYSSADEMLDLEPKPSALAVDMPIGLSEAATRSCDKLAKRRLGARHMCVFYAPTRRALIAPSRIAAGRILCRGVSVFEWELYSKIKNLDHYLTSQHQSWVFEVHPELSFCAINANVPLVASKTTIEGARLRAELLEREFPGLRSGVLDASRTPTILDNCIRLTMSTMQLPHCGLLSAFLTIKRSTYRTNSNTTKKDCTWQSGCRGDDGRRLT